MGNFLGDVLGSIGGRVLEVFLPALITVAATAITGVLVRLFQKLGLQVSEEEEEQVKRTVMDALKRMEEEGRREQLSGEQKRNRAAQIIKQKHPKLDPKVVPGMIDAALPEIRATLHPVPSTPGTFGR
jgi:beta-phosphoglucomutase-like phosphatase (HAD superfamily)